jgi:sugar phosphate isomerase/epimerase
VPFGFSTLGCSGDALESVADLAVATGWLGVELRAASDEPVHIGLTAAERARSRRVLTDAGVDAFAVASYCRVADVSADDDAVVDEVLAHVGLAVDLGARYVRVFPGGDRAEVDVGDTAAVGRLRRIAAGVGSLPVAVALETHDSHPRGADVARVLDRVGDRRVRAIWDALHPWKAGEPVAETASALRDHLAYVQIKDVASAHDLTPVPPGGGVLPLGDIAAALASFGYDGWVSLEWESKWYPTAIPLVDALAAAAGTRELFAASE